jgi:histidinol-phosphate aminotransferase
VDDSLRSLLRPELAELTAYIPASPPGIDLRLDANEAPPAASLAIKEAVARAIAALPLERYPDARARALKEQIAARTGADVDDLLVGTGSDEVISLVLNALAHPRGEARSPVVLVPTPTFVMYRVTARVHGFKVIEVPLDATWDLAPVSMARALDFAPPNVVFIASPNNPTGNTMSEDRLIQLIEGAKGAFVIVDEAYVDYARGSMRRLRERFPNVGILRTLSKVGLAALRVGWLEADAELVREIDKGRQPFNVSATAQVAATSVMRDAWDAVQADVAIVVSERARVAAEMSKIEGFAPSPSDANFVWVRTERPAATVIDALVARGILVRGFHAAGGRLANQLRITIGSPAQNDRLLEALRACSA